MSNSPNPQPAIETRGRARSITMSSASNSRASSIGPSSFTENLTLYMNGQREPTFPDPAQLTPQLPTNATVPSSQETTKARSMMADELADLDVQNLRDELEATLKRHDELMAENGRLRRDLENSTAKALMVGPLERELREARESVKESAPQLESARLQLDVDRLRTEELEDELKTKAKENEDLRTRMRQAEDIKQQLTDEASELRRELGRAKLEPMDRRSPTEPAREDDLDAQSWIDELEDDLERTRHELDKSIKDRQRVERQLEFTKADYEAEKQLVEDLRTQLETAREVEKSMVSRDSPSTPKRVSSTPTPHSSSQNADSLQSAMERANTKIDALTSQLKEARLAIDKHSEDLAAAVHRAEERAQEHAKEQAQAQQAYTKMMEEAQKQLREARERSKSRPRNRSRSASGEDDETAMNRAEAYIRKLKAQEAELKEELRDFKTREAELKQDLRESRAQEADLKQDLRELRANESSLKKDLRNAKTEQEELRNQRIELESALKDSQHEIAQLNGQVTELQAIKERMGRVLMYQWGKEEVGEIERRRGDGKKERGMGYKYKYYNKDGSTKRMSTSMDLD